MKIIISPSHIAAGFVSVLVGYTGAAAIVFQAAAAAGANDAEISSWLWSLGIGMGISGIALSVYYKAPILIAWSTSGAAILVTILPGIPMGEAIGAFLFSSILLVIFGITGWFDKLMQYIPSSLATAMLAGVLLRFGLNTFTAIESELPLVLGMIFCYLLAKRFAPRYVIPITFIIGVSIAASMGMITNLDIDLSLTKPVFTMPKFSLTTIINVGLPLFVVTMASQNLPGIAMLRAHGFKTPASPLISWSGITGLLLAPFGGYAFNLAAITAAICMGKDVDIDPKKRYIAGIWTGIFCIFMGLFGAAVAGIFAAFPVELIMAIAGLALMTTIATNLKISLDCDVSKDAAIITFLTTASGMSLYGIGSAIWGLIFGLISYYIIKNKVKS